MGNLEAGTLAVFAGDFPLIILYSQAPLLKGLGNGSGFHDFSGLGFFGLGFCRVFTQNIIYGFRGG